MSRKTATTLLALVALAPACDRDEPCQPSPGKICTYLGTGDAGRGEDGVHREDAQLYLPQDISFAADGRAYVLDWNNHRIVAVGADDIARQVVGTGELGDAPDGPALEVGLNHPTHLSNSPTGTLIISAWHNSKIIEYDPRAGTLRTICGNGMRSYGGDGGPAKDAILDLPVATAFDALGNMYITDQANQRIRKVGVDLTIETFVGTGMPGFSGDGGPAAAAEIRLPGGQSAPPAGRLAIDGAGNIYLADSGNHRIRKIDPSGVITTYAGNGDPTFGGDGGPAIAASLSRPSDLDLDPAGNLYIADTDNSCVRKVDTAGVITTVAGVCGSRGYGGDGGRAAAALLDRPYGVEYEDGLLYIADTHNHRIRVVGLE
jgi:hypothetical protein